MNDINAEWKELLPKIGNLISHINIENYQINVKLKELQEKEEEETDWQSKIDEVYNKGIQDLYDAIRCLFAPCGRVPLMPVSDMRKLFGSVYAEKIIINKSPEEIIDKVNKWKAEKDKEEQELRVGDEIIVVDLNAEFNDRTFVIYEIDDNFYYVIEPLTLYKDGFFKNAYIKNQIKKTGKHYNSIPLPKEINSP